MSSDSVAVTQPGGDGYHAGSHDLTWQQYCEAVAALGGLPGTVARRHRDVGAVGDTELAAAVRMRDQRLAQASRWRTLGARALSNAQARLVAAQVLIPDITTAAEGAVAGSVEVSDMAADELERRLRQTITDVDSDVAAVRAARRRVVDERARDEREQLVAAQRRRRLRFIGAAVISAAVLLMLIWLM